MKKFKVLLLFAVLVGCTSFPRPRQSWEWWGLLPKSPILAYGKMQPLRADLIRLVEQQNDLKEVVQRSTHFYAAITPAVGEQPSTFAILLLGDFPKGLIGLSLGWNRSWRYLAGNPEQWVHVQQGVAVTLPEDGIILAQNLPWKPRELQGQPVNPPQEFAERSQQVDLFLIFEQPFKYILKNIGEQFPVDYLIFPAIYQSQGFWGTLEVHFSDARQSRFLAPILRLTQRLWIEEIQNLGLEVNPQDLTISVEENMILIGPLRLPLSLVQMLLKTPGD